MNRTPATAVTRLGLSTAERWAATGSARNGSVFTIVDQEKKLRLDGAWYWQDEDKEYAHIMSILDKQGVFGQNHSDPALYIRFPTLEVRYAARDEFARKGLNYGEDAMRSTRLL